MLSCFIFGALVAVFCVSDIVCCVFGLQYRFIFVLHEFVVCSPNEFWVGSRAAGTVLGFVSVAL